MRWIELESTNKESLIENSGHNGIKLLLSPYDKPLAIGIDDKDDKIVIEFKYLDIEEKRANERDSGDAWLTIEIGQNTRRIYKITIDQKAFNNEMISKLNSELIESAIGKLEKKSNSKLPEKYSLAKRLIHNNSQKLFKEIDLSSHRHLAHI